MILKNVGKSILDGKMSSEKHLECSHGNVMLEIEVFDRKVKYNHPFYNWVGENITDIGTNSNLSCAIISNIVPLGEDGRNYFTEITGKLNESFSKLINIYREIERTAYDANFKIYTYSELYELGYVGFALESYCPAYDVFEFKNNYFLRMTRCY